METDKNYFLVGLFVIAMILAGIGFSLWLTYDGRGGYDHYLIRFSESVSGLNKQSMVKFRGVDVGHVDEINIDPENIRLIRVAIRVHKDTPVKTDTTATLKFKGISGEIYIELSGGSEEAPKLQAKNDEEPPEIKVEPNSLNAAIDRLPQITEKADHLLEKTNHIADQIGKIFTDQNVRVVNGVVRNLSNSYGDKENEQPENKK